MRSLLKSFVRWEWVLLLLLMPVLFMSVRVQAALILLLGVLWLVRKAVSGRLVPRTPFDVSLLALGGGLALSLAAVFDWQLSLPKITGLLLGISLFYACVYAMRNSRDGVWQVLAAVLLAGTGMAAAAQALRTFLPGPFGAVINANEIAGVLAWVVPLLAAVTAGYARDLWEGDTWQVRLLPLLLQLALALNLVLLVLTRSRGGILAVSLALALMLAIRFRAARLLLPLLLLGGVAALFLFGGDTPAALLFGGDAVESLGLSSRLEIWGRATMALSDFPITGLGMNNFRKVVHILYPLFTISPEVDLGHAHNQFLQAGLDLGLLGLVAYVALWLGSFALLWNALRREGGNGRYDPLLIGLAGALGGGLLFGLADAIALGARPAFLWWMLLALLVFAYAPRRRVRRVSEDHLALPVVPFQDAHGEENGPPANDER
jgi:O-antigen ligase